jgi:hypothetical protein
MSQDDAFDFRPRAGRIRDRGARAGRRSQSFIAQVLSAATKANGGPLAPAQMRRDGRRRAGSHVRKGRCSRIGRGQAAADRLKRVTEQRGRGERMRRVVVKARIVRLRSGSRAADAHLRYLQRDGTIRGGERGRLYGPEPDTADGSKESASSRDVFDQPAPVGAATARFRPTESAGRCSRALAFIIGGCIILICDVSAWASRGRGIAI